jgi:hypothetical protein
METPVIIVGGGPIGLAVAGDLAWRGMPCLVIERSDGAVRQPKMDLVNVRTMEFCRRWGIVPEIENSGYNRAHVQDNVWVTALAGGYELGREIFPNCIDEPCPPQSPQKRERAPQNFFDPALARFAEGADASSGTEVLAMDGRPSELRKQGVSLNDQLFSRRRPPWRPPPPKHGRPSGWRRCRPRVSRFLSISPPPGASPAS